MTKYRIPRRAGLGEDILDTGPMEKSIATLQAESAAQSGRIAALEAQPVAKVSGGDWSQTASERGVSVVAGLPKLVQDGRVNSAASARHNDRADAFGAFIGGASVLVHGCGGSGSRCGGDCFDLLVAGVFGGFDLADGPALVGLALVGFDRLAVEETATASGSEREDAGKDQIRIHGCGCRIFVATATAKPEPMPSTMMVISNQSGTSACARAGAKT